MCMYIYICIYIYIHIYIYYIYIYYIYIFTKYIASVPALFTCQRACVLTYQKRANFSFLIVSICHKACQCFNLACQHAKRRANFSTWRASMPKSVPIYETFLLQNAKGNFYISLLYKKFYIMLDIILIHIMRICIVHLNCIIQYFLKLFCSLVRDGNIKRLGFYMLQVRRVFSNFPIAKATK